MTPERLKHFIELCFRERRMENRELFHNEIARHFGVTPLTLRRWLSGERPIPRSVEVGMTIYRFYKDVRAEAVDKLIQALDEGTMT